MSGSEVKHLSDSNLDFYQETGKSVGLLCCLYILSWLLVKTFIVAANLVFFITRIDCELLCCIICFLCSFFLFLALSHQLYRLY